MNIKFYNLSLALLGLITLLVACGDSSNNQNNTGNTASLTISLATKNDKAVARASTDIKVDQENKINELMVLVYSDDKLEKVETVAQSSATILGLSLGLKKVVILANPSESLAQEVEKSTLYDNLASLTVGLTDELDKKGEMNTTKGFVMTGQGEIELQPGKNELTISAKRVVAKVKLGKIEIAPLPTYSETDFEVIGVSMLKVRDNSALGFPSYLLTSGKFNYLSGVQHEDITGSYSALLTDKAIKGENTSYFYVTPNDDSEDNCTMMVITAKYKDRVQYFSLKVNDKKTDDSELTGLFIQPNHQYTVDVKIKNLNGGSDNPEKPAEPATLDVTVTPDDWVVVPTQVVEF